MSRFAPRDRSDVALLIAEEVMGVVTTYDAAGYVATPLPLIAHVDADGGVSEIIGHFALANPHVERIRAQPEALVTFLGPHGYIAPAMVSRSGWGPTWNYRFVQLEVTVELAPALNDEAIAMLIRHVEGSGDTAWTTARMGERYARMRRHVVAFRAPVRSASARFKLGQDEDCETFDEIVSALDGTPLGQAMRAQRPVGD